MTRNFNTKSDGSSFDEDIIETVWKKGETEPKYASFRKDKCGDSMQRVKPIASGGTDDLSNLQPLQRENNRHKGDIFLIGVVKSIVR